MAREKSAEKEGTLVRRGSALTPFEEIERWFDDLFSRRGLLPFERGWPTFPELRSPLEGRWPRVDVIDRDTEVVVRAELPGISKDDLDVSLTEDALTIKTSTKREEKEEKGEYYRHELTRGELQRILTLPAVVKGEEAKASFKDGILELILPKAEKAKRLSIKVQ